MGRFRVLCEFSLLEIFQFSITNSTFSRHWDRKKWAKDPIRPDQWISVKKLQFFFIIFCLSIVGVATKSIFCTHLWGHSDRSTTHYHGGALSSRAKTNCKFAVSHRKHQSLRSDWIVIYLCGFIARWKKNIW